MPASYSGRQRVASMSSMRSKKRPPAARAASWAQRAEKAWPRCSRPVGEGAKRVTKRAATPTALVVQPPSEHPHVLEDAAEEGFLSAQRFLEGGELLKTADLGQPVGGAPGGDGGQLETDRVGGVGAGGDQGVARAAVGGILALVQVFGQRLLVARALIHHAVEGRMLAGEADIGHAQRSHRRARGGGVLARGLHRFVQNAPAFVGDGVQQFALVLEVVVGRGRAYARLSRHRPQRERRWPLGL